MTGLAAKEITPVVVTLAVLLALRLYLAAALPFTNDEAYYWDWARAPQLSYLDHPPGVAWMAWIGRQLLPDAGAKLQARVLAPFLHLTGTLMLLACTKVLLGARALTPRHTWTVLLLTQAVPVFSLEGSLLLPDAGLLATVPTALYAFLRADCALANGKRLGRWAVLGGLALGGAGLCKYHAAPLALGLAGGFMLRAQVQGKIRLALSFLAGTALLALFVTTPVWWWNSTHGFASFRFQGDHGFGGLEFAALPAARLYLGQALMLTPLLFASWYRSFRGEWGSPRLSWSACLASPSFLPMAGFLPLFLLIEFLGMGKQLLPHWIAPAYLLLTPALALCQWRPLPWRLNWLYGTAVAIMLPLIISSGAWRHWLLRTLNGHPGPVAEVTLWEPLAEELRRDPRFEPLFATPLQSEVALQDTAHKSLACPKPVVLASLRWFWSAQLSFHLPGQPRVLNLDPNHLSYYSYRDRLTDMAGCDVLVLADARHYDQEQLASVVTVGTKWKLTLASHADVPVVALLGKFRTRAELESLPPLLPVY